VDDLGSFDPVILLAGLLGGFIGIGTWAGKAVAFYMGWELSFWGERIGVLAGGVGLVAFLTIESGELFSWLESNLPIF
jgi:hypothetical protein